MTAPSTRGAVVVDGGPGVGPLGRGARGRRPSTTRRNVARAALDCFNARGYDETTVEEIAAVVGISRRTFFRYYDSKRDVVWGEFDAELVRLEARLQAEASDQPMMDVLRRAMVATNQFDPAELEELRIRIRLIGTVPTLVAHAAVLHSRWCDVVSRFVAGRIGGRPDDLIPQTAARAALGASVTAFDYWATHRSAVLSDVLDQTLRLVDVGLGWIEGRDRGPAGAPDVPLRWPDPAVQNGA